MCHALRTLISLVVFASAGLPALSAAVPASLDAARDLLRAKRIAEARKMVDGLPPSAFATSWDWIIAASVYASAGSAERAVGCLDHANALAKTEQERAYIAQLANTLRAKAKTDALAARAAGAAKKKDFEGAANLYRQAYESAPQRRDLAVEAITAAIRARKYQQADGMLLALQQHSTPAAAADIAKLHASLHAMTAAPVRVTQQPAAPRKSPAKHVAGHPPEDALAREFHQRLLQ